MITLRRMTHQVTSNKEHTYPGKLKCRRSHSHYPLSFLGRKFKPSWFELGNPVQFFPPPKPMQIFKGHLGGNIKDYKYLPAVYLKCSYFKLQDFPLFLIIISNLNFHLLKQVRLINGADFLSSQEQ